MKNWLLSDIPWDQFDAHKVDPEMLRIIKAAALVEYNAADYDHYLSRIFAKDERFQNAAHTWAQEEIQHGRALAQWAKIADPTFDFDRALSTFRSGFQIPQNLDQSVRGSLAGELIARCIVETGTSSFYSALKDATEEPVLKKICTYISADEFRHYKLFYDHLQRFLSIQPLSKRTRLSISLSRWYEADDDELAMAYYAANNTHLPYDRKKNAQSYLGRAYGYYQKTHVKRLVKMLLKASGLSSQGFFAQFAFWLSWKYLHFHKNKRGGLPP